MRAEDGLPAHMRPAVLLGRRQPGVGPAPGVTLKGCVPKKPDGCRWKRSQDLSSGHFSAERQKAGRLTAPQWRLTVVV